MDLLSIMEDVGESTPGLGSLAYIIDRGDVLTFPTAKKVDDATATSYSDFAETATALVFKTGKNAAMVEVMDGMSELKTSYKGEGGNLSPETELTLMKRGTNAEVRGFADYIANRKFMLVVPEVCDKNLLIGTKCRPAFITSIEIDNGKKVGDNNSVTFKLTSYTKPIVYSVGTDALMTPGL